MLVIMVYTVLMKYWFLGPQWPQDNDSFSSTCSENWWVNLLYVNNLVRVDKMVSDELIKLRWDSLGIIMYAVCR